MKLLNLHLENINSLRGQHTVDFKGLFDSSSILLIAGETGSGKSTLLDAIFLALYGKTPRLGSGVGSQASDQSVENVMSRGTAKSSVTLEFSVISSEGGRDRYRAHWRIRCAHDKPGGRVQSAVTSMERWDEEVADWIDVIKTGEFVSFEEARDHALFGMKEQDFLRSVMLAQGQFDTILSADKKERVAALERVVSVDEVERIGRQVHESAKQARDELTQMLTRTQAQEEHRLTSEVRAAHNKELQTLGVKREEYAKSLETLRARVTWSRALQQLTAEQVAAAEAAAAATKAQEDSDEMAASLQEHTRVADAARQIAAITGLRARRGEQQAGLEEAQRQVKASEEKVEPLQAAAVQARVAFETLSADNDARAPQLAAAYEAWEALEKALQTSSNAQKEQAQLSTVLTDAAAELAERSAALANSQTQAKQAHDHAARFEWPDNAPMSLPEIEQLREVLAPLQTSLVSETATLATATKSFETATNALAQHQREESTLLATKDAWLAELGTLRDATKVDGFEKLDLHSADGLSDELRQSQVSLHDYGTRIKAISEQVAELDVSQKALESQRAEEILKSEALETMAAEEKTLAEQRATHGKYLATLREKLATQNRFLELIEELKPGSDCPLCGSDAHKPGDERQREMLREREQTMATTRAEEKVDAGLEAKFETHRVLLQKIRDELSGLRAGIQSDSKLFRKAADEHEHDVTTLRQDHPRRVETLSLEPEALQATLEELRAIAWSLKRQLQEAQSLKARGEEHRLALRSYEARLESFRDQQKQRAEERTVAAQRCETLHEKIRVSLQGAERVFATAMFARWAPKDDAALEMRLSAHIVGLTDLARELKAFEKAVTERKRQQELEANATKEAAGQQAAVDRARIAVNEATARAQSAEAALKAAKERSSTFFEGRPPREVQKRFADELMKSNELAEKRRQELEAATAQHQELVNKRSAADAVLLEITERLAADEKVLGEELAQLELPNEEAVIARRLDPTQATLFSETLSRVADALKSAQIGLASVKERLGKHEATRDSVGEPQEADEAKLQELEVENEALVARRAEIERDLERDDELAKRVEGFREELEELTRQRDEWQQLNELIGVSGGAAFKEFALALSLGRLIGHANEQLEFISKRYVLRQRFAKPKTTGSSAKDALSKAIIPLIDFEIIDTEFCDEVRPVTNISGGERFQLSLAMALGLSAMSQNTLPIETLMIDEGFGTLDPETLSKAIETLESLYQRTGARVALISHVESLRERLPTQIVVRKRGGGQSDLEQIDGFGAGSRI